MKLQINASLGNARIVYDVREAQNLPIKIKLGVPREGGTE